MSATSTSQDYRPTPSVETRVLHPSPLDPGGAEGIPSNPDVTGGTGYVGVCLQGTIIGRTQVMSLTFLVSSIVPRVGVEYLVGRDP